MESEALGHTTFYFSGEINNCFGIQVSSGSLDINFYEKEYVKRYFSMNFVEKGIDLIDPLRSWQIIVFLWFSLTSAIPPF